MARARPRAERFLLNKLLTGEFRVGVAQTLVVRALGAGGRHRADDRRRAADGRLDAVGRVVRGSIASTAPAAADPLAALSVLPRVAARDRPDGRSATSATGWSSGSGTASARSSCAARSRLLALVARRRADHAPVSGDRGGGHAPAGRHRARRRGPRLRATGGRCRSRHCSSASAARSRSRRSCAAVPVVFIVYDLLEHERHGHPHPSRSSSGASAPRASRRTPPVSSDCPMQWCRIRGTDLAALRLGVARARRRGIHAQAADIRVRRRTAPWRLVEVEDRSVHRSTPSSSTRSPAADGAPAC